MNGRIVQISGSVIDVAFPEGNLPKIREALTVSADSDRRVMEVAQHVDSHTVRCIMLSESEGLYRGMEVTATGDNIRVPVGEATLGNGRVFITAQKDPTYDEPSPSNLYKTGTVCQIKHVTKNQNGNLLVTFEGVCRAKIVDYYNNDGYITADVIFMRITTSSTDMVRTEAARKEIFNTIEEYTKLNSSVSDEFKNAASSLRSPRLFS